MKAVLYVGATLMVGATIYGFADYKKTSHNNEFKKMYETTDEKLPVVEEKSTTEAIMPVVEKDVKAGPASTAKKENKIASAAKVVKKSAVKSKSKWEKLSLKEFSRGSLREFTPPVVKDDDIKEETVKTEKRIDNN